MTTPLTSLRARGPLGRWLDRRYGPKSGLPCSAGTNNCQFWFRGADYGRPGCCTQHLLELAQFASQLLTRHGVKFWLDYGTLLGAARDGHLIAWDDDIDMGMLATDVPVVRSLSGEIARAGYLLVDSDPYVLRVQYSRFNYSHVDLYHHQVVGDDLVMNFYDGLEWPGTEQYRVPRHYFEHLTQVYLEGEPFPAPFPLEEFIERHRYGPNWRTPVRRLLLPWRIPRVRPEDVNPTVVRLLDELGHKQGRVLQLQARPLGRVGHEAFWQLWQEAARPLSVDPGRLAALTSRIPAEDDTHLVRELVAALAALDQSIEELETGAPLRRATRRLRRLPSLVYRQLVSRQLVSRQLVSRRLTRGSGVSARDQP